MLKLKTTDHNIWFTSDTHAYHKNITRGVSDWESDGMRDFNTLEDMTDHIVKAINYHVKEDDILFHLGDWSFGGIDKIWEFRKRIKCKNIHLIYGNHDHHIIDNKLLPNVKLGELFGTCEVSQLMIDFPLLDSVCAQDIFSSTQHYLEIEIGKQLLCLMHYPIQEWNNRPKDSIHLHGHSHGNCPTVPKRLDVGMDNIFKLTGEYRPINYNELTNYI